MRHVRVGKPFEVAYRGDSIRERIVAMFCRLEELRECQLREFEMEMRLKMGGEVEP